MSDINLLKDMTEAIQAAGKQQARTTAYDTEAEVRRVEGGTAWVHIPGGVDETPVKLTIAAKAGDTVQIRVSGGSAWMVGNATAPPTDDTRAKHAEQQAREAAGTATNFVTDTRDGVFVHPKDNTKDGVRIQKTLEIIRAGESVAEYGDTVRIGKTDGAHYILENNRITGKSKNVPYIEFGDAGSTVIQKYTGNGVATTFSLYYATEVTAVTVGGTATTAYTLNQGSPTTYGSITFNTAPASGAAIVIEYETEKQRPYFTFGSREETELPNGPMSATFGERNTATAPCSFAEGSMNEVYSVAGHAEGKTNKVTGHAAHAEGWMNDALGEGSHVEGGNNSASGKYCHVGGFGNSAPYNYQTIIGNGAPTGASDDLFVVGNADYAGQTSAAMRLKRSGRVEFGGAVGTGLSWNTRTEMVNAASGLQQNRPYLFAGGATWSDTAGSGNNAAFGILCKTSSTSWRFLYMAGSNIYKSVFTWDGTGTTTGTFSTTQIG